MMKDKISRYLIGGILGLFLILSAASCTFIESMFADKLVTTLDNVKPEYHSVAVQAPVEGIVPKETLEKLKAEGKIPVIVPESGVIERNIAIAIQKPDSDFWGDLAGLGLSVANTIWPGIAALEGLGLLFSQRKRMHYTAAVKAITPYDGDVAIKEAVVSLAKATGLAHSSEASKTAATTETTAA
jgi:hypothetical protein